MINKLTVTTAAQAVFARVNSGNNNLRDWYVNSPAGTSSLGTPFYDSVKFKLDDYNISDEYINTVISVSNQASVVRTNIQGRKGGSVKQMVGEGDYDVIFNIKVLATPEFWAKPNITGLKPQTVGNANSLGAVGRFIAEPISSLKPFDPKMSSYLGDYAPNGELGRLVSLLNLFYKDVTYKNITVSSFYLNDVFKIKNIVPYSIQTQQNPESTNTYNVIISAYSDFAENTDTEDGEIIPK